MESNNLKNNSLMCNDELFYFLFGFEPKSMKEIIVNYYIESKMN